MSEINDILALYQRVSDSKSKHALATVISTSGPSYRSAGARSLIVEDGTFRGGLSAGCLEGDIACRLDGVTDPFIVEYDLSTEDDIRGFPFGCGGTVRIYVEPLPNIEALRAVQWLSELHEPAVLLTVVASKNADYRVGMHFAGTNSRPGEFAPDFAKSPESSADSQFLQIIHETLEQKKSVLHQIEINQTNIQIFAEYFEPAINLCIFGDGEDALALVSLAETVGLNVNRVTRHQIRTSVALTEEISGLNLSYAVVMTHDLTLDTKILHQLVPVMPTYLGVMGPRSRTEKMLNSLGVETETVVSHPSFYSPVGLNMAAETPQEIALSILAEVQSIAHKCVPSHLRDFDGAIHDRKNVFKLHCDTTESVKSKNVRVDKANSVTPNESAVGA